MVAGAGGPGLRAAAGGEGGGHVDLRNAVGYSTAWLVYNLFGLPDARDAFVGDPPEIADNDGWIDWDSRDLP